jgi:hypothetical protein
MKLGPEEQGWDGVEQVQHIEHVGCGVPDLR